MLNNKLNTTLDTLALVVAICGIFALVATYQAGVTP